MNSFLGRRKKEKRGNYEPLLKLAWVEWFYVPFMRLHVGDFDLTSWVYSVSTVDNVATVGTVQRIADLGVDATTRRVADSFLRTRRFLEARYAGKGH